MNFTDDVIDNLLMRMNDNTRFIGICLDKVTEEQLWQKPVETSNSIGNQILHLLGNITQYVLSGVGDAVDVRHRDLEFSSSKTQNKHELSVKLNELIGQVSEIARQTERGKWAELKVVQGFEMSRIGCLIHATEHYSYHTGQIALITKLMVNEDLGFWNGMDLNKTSD